jgi:hypothetical protein
MDCFIDMNRYKSRARVDTIDQNNRSSLSSNYHLDQVIFLHARDVNPLTATLITAGSLGWIWFWSMHVIGCLLAVFNGARTPQGEHHCSIR